MRTLKGFIQLTRPVNMLICGLSVVCGGILGGKPLDRFGDIISFLFTHINTNLQSWELRTLSGAVSASLILASGNAFNDVMDLHCDKINIPHRPIPSGMVTPAKAVIFAVILALAGILLSLPLGIPGIAVALCAVALLAAYDTKLKGVPLAGNITVAILGGLAFVYGGIAGNSITRALLPAAFAAFFHLGRELLKDAADERGDLSSGLNTAATAWGKETACLFASTVLMVLAVFTVIPFTFGFFGVVYFLLIALGVWPVLLYASISSLRDSSEKNLRRISRLLKMDMPMGIIAVLAGFQGL